MKVKKTVYILTLFFLLVPFVLITDIFPFLRFGMFAEPVDADRPMEIFYVMYKDINDGWTRFDPEQYQMQDETFQYLARNHYYRKEGKLLLEKLGESSDVIRGEHWKFFKVSFPPGFPEFKDTVLISEY